MKGDMAYNERRVAVGYILKGWTNFGSSRYIVFGLELQFLPRQNDGVAPQSGKKSPG